MKIKKSLGTGSSSQSQDLMDICTVKDRKRAPDLSLTLFSFMLRRMGLEPTRPTGHKILSLACLPISAPPRDSYNIQPRNIKVKKKIALIQKNFDHGYIKTGLAELLQIFKLTHFEQYHSGSHPLLLASMTHLVDLKILNHSVKTQRLTLLKKS